MAINKKAVCNATSTKVSEYCKRVVATTSLGLIMVIIDSTLRHHYNPSACPVVRISFLCDSSPREQIDTLMTAYKNTGWVVDIYIDQPQGTFTLTFR